MKGWFESIRDVSVSVAALVLAVAALVFSIQSAKEERNARLVEIGVSILRIDPDKAKQVRPAREWALNLIDANAGGITFSAEARADLLNKPLHLYTDEEYSYDGAYFDDGPHNGKPDPKPQKQNSD